MDALHAFFAVFIPLVIIMDPFGNLPIFLLFTEHNSSTEKKRMAAIAAVAAFVILLFFSLTGDMILRFFGIGLPAFEITGGIIFFIYSLQMLHIIPGNLKTSAEEREEGIAKENIAIVPLATPMLAGPGAITAILVWQHDPARTLPMVIIITSIFLSCLLVYLVFYFGPTLLRLLGVTGLMVATRLMGLLLAVLAVQFITNGIQALMK